MLNDVLDLEIQCAEIYTICAALRTILNLRCPTLSRPHCCMAIKAFPCQATYSGSKSLSQAEADELIH